MNENLVNQDKTGQAFNTAGQLIAEGETVRQIQTSYITAVSVQIPRDLAKVEDRCMKEAALAGEVCFYGWGSGKDRIEGPSIDCAMIAARNWGNNVLEMKPEHETASDYIFEAVFVDLETGFTYTRQFRQSKRWKVYGKMDEERKDTMRYQIGQSKAQRNTIFKALPAWLIDKMVETAKKGVREKLEKYIDRKGVEAARKLALDALAKCGVALERIEYKYGKKYGAWDIELLIILKGDIRALTDGAESADSLFPFPEEQENGAETGVSPGLSPENMKAGDEKTHQGYGNKKAVDLETGEVKEDVAPKPSGGKVDTPKDGIKPDDLKPEKPPEPGSTEEYQAELRKGTGDKDSKKKTQGKTFE